MATDKKDARSEAQRGMAQARVRPDRVTYNSALAATRKELGAWRTALWLLAELGDEAGRDSTRFQHPKSPSSVSHCALDWGSDHFSGKYKVWLLVLADPLWK